VKVRKLIFDSADISGVENTLGKVMTVIDEGYLEVAE